MLRPRCKAVQTPPLVDMCAPNFTWRNEMRTCGQKWPGARPKPLQAFGLGQELRHSSQESTSGPAIQDAMIEAQGHIRLHHRDKFSSRLVPVRDAMRSTHTQYQRLLGQGYRRGPSQTE